MHCIRLTWSGPVSSGENGVSYGVRVMANTSGDYDGVGVGLLDHGRHLVKLGRCEWHSGVGTGYESEQGNDGLHFAKFKYCTS